MFILTFLVAHRLFVCFKKNILSDNCGLLYLDIDLTLYGLLFVQYIFSA